LKGWKVRKRKKKGYEKEKKRRKKFRRRRRKREGENRTQTANQIDAFGAPRLVEDLFLPGTYHPPNTDIC